MEWCVQNTKGLAIFIKETAVAKKTKKKTTAILGSSNCSSVG
jgi:hypothetical protein